MKSSLWGERDEVAPTESMKSLMTSVERSGFTWKNPVAVDTSFPFLPSALWSLQCLLFRPDRNLLPKEISSRSCFFPSLPKSAKYLLKCAAHSEAKLELAAAPPGTQSWQSAAPSSSPGCCGRTACPPQKQPPIFFSLHVHVSHYCAAAPEE